jgi:SNF2 family DNA or RNA helicase
MICKDTIEEKIIKLQQSKMSLSEELISEDDGFVKNLSENDLEFLFE